MTYIDPIKMWHYDTRQHHPVATSYGFLGVCAQMLAESSDSQLTDVHVVVPEFRVLHYSGPAI